MRKEVSSATGISDGMSAAEGCDMERSPARPEGWICSMLSELHKARNKRMQGKQTTEVTYRGRRGV